MKNSIFTILIGLACVIPQIMGAVLGLSLIYILVLAAKRRWVSERAPRIICILLLILGSACGGFSLWVLKLHLNWDYSERRVFSICEKPAAVFFPEKKKTKNECIDDQKREMRETYLVRIYAITVFSILSILFLILGRWTYRRRLITATS